MSSQRRFRLIPDQRERCFDSISLVGRFVATPAQNSGEANGDARFVAFGRMNPFKSDLKHQLRFDGSRRPEPLQGVAPDPTIQLEDLLIIQPE
jgi:hypothetical protein